MGNRRLNILFITPWYPVAGRPDGSFVQELARAVHLYHEVAVLHHAGKEPTLRQIWRMTPDPQASATAAFPVYRFYYRTSLLPNSAFALFGLWSLLGAVRELMRQGYRPDLLHIHEYPFAVPALLLRRLYGLPVVITEHSSTFVKRSLTPAQVRLARFAFARADRVLPVSQAMQAAIEAYGIRAKFEIIPNVVDTTCFYPAPEHPQPTTKRLLFVGLFDPWHRKGIPQLLQALAQLPRRDWQLDLLGDGPSRADYEALAVALRLGGQVTFHGYQTQAQVAQFMRNSQLFVLPSLAETFGVVLIEAFASGLPVIATQTAGPSELVTDEVGLLVPPGDVAALATAINTMLDRYPQYAPKSLAAYAADHFGYAPVSQRLDGLYRTVVAERGQIRIP